MVCGCVRCDQWTFSWHAQYHSLTFGDQALGSSEWIIGSWLALLVAIVSLQQVAVILASNVGLTERMLCHSRCFFLMVELLFFAQSVFVGRFLLLA